MHAADLLTNRARLTPNREALLILETGQRYTYAELNSRACQLANTMQTLGVKKGDRVSILAQNGIEYIDLFYGLAKIGAIFAPLNWRLTAKELEYIVNDLEPSVMFVGPEFVDLANELREMTQVEHYLALESAPFGEGTLQRSTAYETIFQAPTTEPARPALDPDDPYCILYTSGTTGKPKGAMIPHRQILWNCINTVISWGLTEHDVSPVYTPLFHAGGLFAFLTPILYIGGRVLLSRGFSPEETIRYIVDEKCTVILGVPTLFQMWRDSPAYKDADFCHVHYFINGGASCPVELMDAWRKEKQIIFRQGYGLTEVGPNCFSMTDEESEPKSGSVGKPIIHSEMRLINPETGEDVGANEPGELLIKGPHVTTGYWRNPEATAKSVVDGWFHTGDTARRDDDGFYTIIGRYKDMIKSGGENIYAAEVEGILRQHPAVAECALIGKPDEKWGEVGLMIVVLEKGQTTTDTALKNFCRDKLARFKIPKEFVFTDALPYSPYGKVEKVKLKEKYL
ncbi:MAG: long-chain fatty acid--CoA ligase [Anaerolineales bacterium]|nr:long-chain fatty acid--CoA ligase [Anaerolineales bacterium]